MRPMVHSRALGTDMVLYQKETKEKSCTGGSGRRGKKWANQPKPNHDECNHQKESNTAAHTTKTHTRQTHHTVEAARHKHNGREGWTYAESKRQS